MNTVARTAGSVIGSYVAVTLPASTPITSESDSSASLWLGAGAASIAALPALGISSRRGVPQEVPATSPG
jgi:hypothetical protein